MILILTHLQDDAALQLSAALQRAGVDCTVVAVESLSFAARRTHRVHDLGTETVIELANGVVLDSAAIDGVLNRMCSAPAGRLASPGDQQHAAAELHAFVLSWLGGLTCPVRNRPDPQFLGGPAPHPTVALVEAARSGLSSPTRRLGARVPARRVRVVFLDGVPYAPLGVRVPERVAESARRLLGRLGADEALVSIDFVVEGDGWQFLGLDSQPDLPDEPAFVEHLAQVLGGRRLVTAVESERELVLAGAA